MPGPVGGRQGFVLYLSLVKRWQGGERHVVRLSGISLELHHGKLSV